MTRGPKVGYCATRAVCHLVTRDQAKVFLKPSCLAGTLWYFTLCLVIYGRSYWLKKRIFGEIHTYWRNAFKRCLEEVVDIKPALVKVALLHAVQTCRKDKMFLKLTPVICSHRIYQKYAFSY